METTFDLSIDTALNTYPIHDPLYGIPLLGITSSQSSSSCTSSSSFTYYTNQHQEVLKIPHIQIHADTLDMDEYDTPLKATPSVIGMSGFSFLEIQHEIKCLHKNGYMRRNTRHMCDSLQGEVFMAQTVEGINVAIKKTYKTLHYQQMSMRNGGRVQENIVKEAMILRHLTVDNKPSNGGIIKLIQFFESDDAFYLVTEHVGTQTLAGFNQQAHQLLAQKKLKPKKWKQIVKYLVWQLSVIIYWLHNDMQCCHLDLCLRNIMVSNGEFIEDNEGNVDFDPNISLKLLDFGLSEVFHRKTKHFQCNKYGERERHYLSAPRVFAEEMFDARKADVWSLGIILYELATGLEPYRAQDVMGGKKKVTQPNTLDNLMRLIALNGKSKCVNQSMIQLMAEMLHIEEEKRVNVDDILHNPWMSLYYKRYKAQIAKKSEFQSLKNKRRVKEMNGFPFYNA
eukprot:69894_1